MGLITAGTGGADVAVTGRLALDLSAVWVVIAPETADKSPVPATVCGCDPLAADWTVWVAVWTTLPTAEVTGVVAAGVAWVTTGVVLAATAETLVVGATWAGALVAVGLAGVG